MVSRKRDHRPGVPCAVVEAKKVIGVIIAIPDARPDPSTRALIAVPHENGASTVDTRWEWFDGIGIRPGFDLAWELAEREAESPRAKALIEAEAAKDPEFWAKAESNPEMLDRLFAGGR